MAIWQPVLRDVKRDKLETTGRHWYVKRDYTWLWLIVCAVLGMALLSGALFFAGSRGK